MNFNEIVDSHLRRYIGGQVFFTSIDSFIKKNVQLFIPLVEKAEKLFPNNPLVLSGEFGRKIGLGRNRNRIILPGGLRHMTKFDSIRLDRPFIFVDDSFFSGRTLDAIEVITGQRCLKSFVVYNGNREKRPNVQAMFRYYDWR